jgi:hypothetical protein
MARWRRAASAGAGLHGDARLRARDCTAARGSGCETVRRRGRSCGGGEKRGGAGGFGKTVTRVDLRWRIEEDDEKKQDLIVRLKRLRSAFHAMTGRGGRMTGRDGVASGQSPVSSWCDRTRPVRDDRTLTESGQSLPGNPTRMTGRGGGGRDRTRWSQRRVRCSVRSQIHEKIFGMTGHAGGHRDRMR